MEFHENWNTPDFDHDICIVTLKEELDFRSVAGPFLGLVLVLDLLSSTLTFFSTATRTCSPSSSSS